VLLALDASTTNLGFGFGGPGASRPKGGVRKLPGADEMVFDHTLSKAYEMVSGLCMAAGIRHVYIEAPLLIVDAGHAAHTSMALIQLTGALRAAAARAHARVTLVAISTVRKNFIGHGRLPGREAKAAVQARCRQLGWDFDDDNHADALAVWAYGMALLYPKWAPQTEPLFVLRRDGAA
jgi:Holliday junction resolvasome RuvABC endonuclease subunit